MKRVTGQMCCNMSVLYWSPNSPCRAASGMFQIGGTRRIQTSCYFLRTPRKINDRSQNSKPQNSTTATPTTTTTTAMSSKCKNFYKEIYQSPRIRSNNFEISTNNKSPRDEFLWKDAKIIQYQWVQTNDPTKHKPNFSAVSDLYKKKFLRSPDQVTKHMMVENWLKESWQHAKNSNIVTPESQELMEKIMMQKPTNRGKISNTITTTQKERELMEIPTKKSKIEAAEGSDYVHILRVQKAFKDLQKASTDKELTPGVKAMMKAKLNMYKKNARLDAIK